MKKWPVIMVFFMLLNVVWLSGCQRPIDGCLDDSDCTLSRRDVRVNNCCVWVAINASLAGWYKEKADKMICPVDCPLMPPVKPVCRDGRCVVEKVR